MYFIDSNIFLRVLLNDHPTVSPACKELIEKIKDGKIEAYTSDLVIVEIVFILSNKKSSSFNRENIERVLVPLLALDHLVSPAKLLWKKIFAVYVQKNVDFIDAYNANVMESQGVSTIYSYDRDFSKLSPLKRLVP